MDTTTSGKYSQKSISWGITMKTALTNISKVILMTICFLLYLVMIPVFFILVTPLYMYRLIVLIAQKSLMQPDWVGMMSTRDAIVGLDNITDNCECMITLLLTLKGEASISLVRQVFLKEVINGKNLQGKLSYQKLQHYFDSWLGFTFWKRETNFKLEDHVRPLEPNDSEDPNNNSEVVTEEQLMRSLGALSTRPFPQGVSPWEALVIKRFKKSSSRLHHDVKETVPLGDDSDDNMESALVLRIHHAIGDGYSIMKLIMYNLCGGSMSAIPRAPVRQKTPLEQLVEYIAIVFFTPYDQISQFFFNIDKTIWHLPSPKLTKKWNITMTERLSFDGIKTISTKHGVCVTATLIAGLAGGIHNFLKNKGKASKNTRVMRGLSPMPWKNHPMETLVNHWAIGVFDVPVQETCAQKRLDLADQSVNSLKKSPIVLSNFLTVPLLFGVPRWLTNFWGENWMTTLIISNFPGPNIPVNAFYNSNYISEVISWVPHMRGSAGMGVMFISYNGGVRISLSVDKAIIEDHHELEELSNLISEEFLNLRSLSASKDNIV